MKNPLVRAAQACSRPTFGVLGWEQVGRLRGTGVERKDFLRVYFFSRSRSVSGLVLGSVSVRVVTSGRYIPAGNLCSHDNIPLSESK